MKDESLAISNALAPAKMARVRTVDERYQSYNVEMLEVTGDTETAETACGGNRWAGTFLDTFRYLDPARSPNLQVAWVSDKDLCLRW